MTTEETTKSKRTFLSKEMFDKLSASERDQYLLDNASVLEDIVLEWGLKWGSAQDTYANELRAIRDNHSETVNSLKEISKILGQLTQAIFGDKQLDLTGIVSKQSELNGRIGLVESRLNNFTNDFAKKTDVSEIEKDIQKKIETISVNSGKTALRLKWTLSIASTVAVGGIAFIAWITDKAIEIMNIVENLPHKP